MLKQGKKIRINLNKLRVSLLFVLVLVIYLTIGLKATAANFTEENGNPAYIEVIVKSGDSLWELTEKHYNGNSDIRKVIYQIKEINNLSNANIVSGQIIKIPQY
ncbi:MAG: LysM peptidoglycan-binding domain-containing protein [Dehalobacterium sp.]